MDEQKRRTVEYRYDGPRYQRREISRNIAPRPVGQNGVLLNADDEMALLFQYRAQVTVCSTPGIRNGRWASVIRKRSNTAQ